MGKRVGCFLCTCLVSSILAANVWAQPGQAAAAAVAAKTAETEAIAETAVSPQEEAPSIEQVYIEMPEITVYGYGLLGEDGIEAAYLGEEKLEFTSSQPFSQSGEGIQYYILLDRSNSMPDSYFSRIKEGILEFCSSCQDQDRVTMILFGETVQVLWDGGKDLEQWKKLLDGVENQDNKTLLFEAVSQASDLAGKRTSEQGRRNVMLVFSDGEDVAVGKKMSQEALEDLKEKGIPVYAMCISDTARENINSFGEFARLSGGDIQVFKDQDTQEAIQTVQKRLMSAAKLTFKASSNKASNRYERFSIHLQGGDVPLNKEVFSFRWIPDQSAPQITSARQIEGRKIELTFSEPVVGGDIASNYSLRGEAGVIPISAVAYEADHVYIITASEPLTEGEYTIVGSNITDHSQEGNLLTGEYQIHLEASEADPAGGKDSTGVMMGLAAILAAVILLAAAVILYHKVKKNRGVVFVDEKPVMASSVDVRHHVAIREGEKKPFQLLVTVAGKHPEKLELTIDKSMIVGRSSICDLFFDDNRMSRQHFVLEWDGTDMYIMDLETTNGTSVNGVRIQERRKLEKGDRINAGAEELLIQW